MVPPKPKVEPIPNEKLPEPIVFHDGRLVQKPTPLMALLIILWIPIAFPLPLMLWIAAGSLLPMPLVYYAFWALGVRITVPPPPIKKSTGQSGVLFICSHRTLLDPIFLSTALGHPSPPSPTLSLVCLRSFPQSKPCVSPDRAKDASMIKKLLEEGDVAICPEGTTCREPFLLMFSASWPTSWCRWRWWTEWVCFMGRRREGGKGCTRFISSWTLARLMNWLSWTSCLWSWLVVRGNRAMKWQIIYKGDCGHAFVRVHQFY